ncbi:SPOR domain-containing protein [Tatumella ptyseos]|uniref:SPOR domain-containing protein n=1 Tax=Tatumella ptyseos TaxID=82987 RepID=UPI0026ED0BF4|nr:SPOR domain-containing protein [Tatumella ptyseos]WKX26642.1 SPOR domain-containing protein [Tatumella ptyseos]
MDDFQPEDELKPDTSDRPAPRGKKPAQSSKLPISKQHLMIAVGILVLLLLVLGIGSAMNSSSSPKEDAAGQGNERNIDLSGNGSADNSTVNANNQPSQQADTQTPTASNNTTSNDSIAPTENNGQETQQPAQDQASVASLPTAAATLDRNAKLSSSTQTSQQPSSADMASTPPIHPSAPSEQHTRAKAPVTHSEPRQPNHRSEVRHVVPEHRETVSRRQPEHSEAKKVVAPKAPVRTAEKQAPVTTTTSSQPAKATPAPAAPSREAASGKGYTLQLSGASREDTLNAWAKQQNLASYQVYKTSRNGQAWYVLTTGNYKTPAEAKSAISSLPEAVKAKSPWVKPMSQVRKESAQ